jgi:hypothetical protein
MEFEQYLEKDIIIFLEGKTDKKVNVVIDREEEYGVYLTRDYLKELSYALDNDELTKAKKLFDELKVTFSRLAKNSIERKKTYALLEKMYEKIQNYVKIKEGKIEIIKQGESEIHKDPMDKFTEISSSALSDQVKISPELSKEFESETNAELPIHSGKNKDSKKKNKDNASVESKIVDKNESNYDNKTEAKETSEEDDILHQNVFFKRKSGTDDTESESSRKLMLRNYDIDDTTSEGWQGDIFEYIDYNTNQLNRLKTRVIEKLLDDLRKKLEETNSEHEKKIEALRREIFEEMSIELDKILKSKRDIKNISQDSVENLREEILGDVYNSAGRMISSKDIDSGPKDVYFVKDTNPHTENISEMSPTISPSLTSKDVIDRYDEQKEARETYARLSDKHLKHHGMMDKNSNKTIKDRYFKRSGENKIIDGDDISDMDTDNNKNPASENFDELNKTADSAYNIEDLQKYGLKPHAKIEEATQKMYEEAIYTMFQNNYDSAAKIFQEILRVRPGNKAALIRLQECIEAIGNV